MRGSIRTAPSSRRRRSWIGCLQCSRSWREPARDSKDHRYRSCRIDAEKRHPNKRRIKKNAPQCNALQGPTPLAVASGSRTLRQSGHGRTAAALLSDVLPTIAGFFSTASRHKVLLHHRAAAQRGDASELIPIIAGSKSDRPKVQTVAVLPFINMGANQDDEYFCDGLAEDLLN